MTNSVPANDRMAFAEESVRTSMEEETRLEETRRPSLGEVVVAKRSLALRKKVMAMKGETRIFLASEKDFVCYP